MKSKRLKKEQDALDKLDKEFDHYEVVVTLERIEKQGREFLQKSKVLESPSGFRAHEDNFTEGRRTQVFSKKIELGGKSEGEERRLKAKLIKDMKTEGYKEDLSASKARAGRLGGLKSKGGGRKKGTKFDKELGRFVSEEERRKMENERRRKG